jgi:MerR family copper efflux transcriptional regulator
MNTANLLKIGELSTKTDISIKTIRYYESLELLQSNGRTEGHFRLFHPNAVARLNFIKRLQTFGFSLNQIKTCLSVYDQGDLPCHEIQQQLIQQVSEIENKIKELNLLHSELNGILQRWQADPTEQAGTICPNLKI